jgi:pterin-4a-carbinolamine dehydratase
MGRVAVLRQTSKSSATDAVAELTRLAQGAITDGHSKDAADLLRASEHLSFGVLAGEVSGVVRVSAELKESITEQVDELMRRADEHWEEEEEHSSLLTDIYESSRASAGRAFRARAYHQALEFARAAEALAHVKQHGPLKLEIGHNRLQLKSA